MKIAAITKFKVGEIYQALRRLGWTQKEFALRCGMTQNEIGGIINLKHKPTVERCDRMQAVLEIGRAHV